MSESEAPIPADTVSPERLPGGDTSSAVSAGAFLTERPSLLNEDRAGHEREHRTVPYGALAEERARRKELQRELQGAIEAQQKLQGRLDLLHELAQQHAIPNAEDREAVSEVSEP